MNQQRQRHPLAGRTVDLQIAGKPDTVDRLLDGKKLRVEDWWTNVAGRSWKLCDGNPACLMYAMRSAFAGLPIDDEVIYGKLDDGSGHLVHASEIAPEATAGGAK
ncbi:MAG TPA: hypothetical protein VGN72_05080 [Tepidisphaeraceae bacterium]|nr:hypothetical protein [Tepidisphaeraceae bacterium]